MLQRQHGMSCANTAHVTRAEHETALLLQATICYLTFAASGNLLP